MEQLIFKLAEAGETIIQIGWLPLLIWTVIGSALWLLLRRSDNIHPEYHYHTRLALILSLPAGFTFLAVLEKLSALVAASAFETNLKMITVTAPIGITVTPAEATASLPLSSILYSVFFLVIAGGLIVTLGRFIRQCIQLRQLRNHCDLFNLLSLDDLNAENKSLAMAAQKPVQAAFLKNNIVPVTFGIRQPVILLPVSLKRQPKKMNLAIRHELTHITQHDFITHLLVIITEALFWFHPLVHRLKRELVEYREMRCDHLVLSEKSVSRKEYASLLLELIPMPNIDKNLSVNMAQESSNLKKRISMITQQINTKPIPKRTSLALLGAIFLSTAIVMACTDMQTQNVFDEEELNIMTDVDRSGERGYHQVIIYMGDEDQSERHSVALDQLRILQPDYIQSVEVLKGNDTVDQFGDRASNGVILVKTKLDRESYNTVLNTLGMEVQDIPPPPEPGTPDDDHFVVVEQMPELVGGLSAIMQEIRYPEEAREAGLEGRVFVQFVVTEDGNVEDPQIIRSAGKVLDDEALRVVRMAKFKPGMQRGRPVRVQYSLPVFFRLQGSETTPEHSDNIPQSEYESLNEMTVTSFGGSKDSSTNVYPEFFHHQTDLENLGSLMRESNFN